MPRLVILCVCIALSVAGGCRAKPKPDAQALPATAPATQPLTPQASQRPLLDLARGVGGLPLNGVELPSSAVLLRDSILTAQKKRFTDSQQNLPQVNIDESAFPQLRRLAVDVSNGEVRADYKPGEMKSPKFTDNVLAVDQFEYRAWPIRYAHARGFVSLHATGVQLGLLREGDDAALVMTDAQSGQLEMAFTIEDLRQALQAGARLHAGRAGLMVRNLELSMALESADTLSGTIDLWGNWFLLPVHLRLTGRMRIDDSFHAHISDLDVAGRNIGGRAVAGLLDKTVRKNNGKILPLVRFAGERIHLQNMQMRLDDEWRLSAQFGSRLDPAQN